MAVYASYRNISFELVETLPGEWRWSFQPPSGARRSGRVVGEQRWAFAVVERAIDVWHQMNPGAESAAA